MEHRLNTSEVICQMEATNMEREHAEVIVETINDATRGLVTAEDLDRRLDILKSELRTDISTSETKTTQQMSASEAKLTGRMDTMAMIIAIVGSTGFIVLSMVLAKVARIAGAG